MSPFYMFKSWLGLLNFFVLQWLFVRLARESIPHPEAEGAWVTSGYRVLRYIVPMTGWWNRYWFIWRPSHIYD